MSQDPQPEDFDRRVTYYSIRRRRSQPDNAAPMLTRTTAPGAGTGFVEEFVFRGVMQKAALEAMGNWGLYYVAFLFAILHLIHNSPLDVLLVFLIGLFFGWIVKRTGSLFGVTLAHTITNYLLFVILPYVVNL